MSHCKDEWCSRTKTGVLGHILYGAKSNKCIVFTPKGAGIRKSGEHHVLLSKLVEVCVCVINVFRTPGEFDDTVLTEFQVGQRSGSMSPGIFPVEVIVSTHLGRMCGVQLQNKVADD